MKIKQIPLGIGQNIKKLRIEAGYSRTEFVREIQLLGIKMTYDIYKKIEINKYNIRISELIAIKQILNTTYDDLFANLSIDDVPDNAD